MSISQTNRRTKKFRTILEQKPHKILNTYEFEGEIRIFNGAVILSDKLILYLGFVFMCTGTTTTYVQVRKALFYCIRNTCMYRKSECIFNNIFKQYFLTIFLDIL
jgi:hypothetical protein